MDFAFSTNTKRSKDPKEADHVENMIILGSGPAGLAAALYAARAELTPLVLTGMELGGQAAITNVIENYPGFPDGVGGAELGGLFQKQAEHFGARIVMDSATNVDLSTNPFLVSTYTQQYRTKSLIIATGASPVHLGVPGENEFIGLGTSYCATCDGYFFRDKKVVVVGGGDSALEEALFLTRYASSVTIIHRRDSLRAGAILQKRAKDHPKISFIWNTVVKSIEGDGKVQAVRLNNVISGEETIFPTDGVFIFIGHHPNTVLFNDQLKMNSGGYIETDFKMQTSIPGVFAAGETMDPNYRQVITSAGMGAAAAIQAAKYLEKYDE